MSLLGDSYYYADYPLELYEEDDSPPEVIQTPHNRYLISNFFHNFLDQKSFTFNYCYSSQ